MATLSIASGCAVRMLTFLLLLLGVFLLERSIRGNSVLLMLLLSIITPLPASGSIIKLLNKASPKLLLVLRIYCRIFGIHWTVVTSALKTLCPPVDKVKVVINRIRRFFSVITFVIYWLSVTPPLILKLLVILSVAILTPMVLCLSLLKQLLQLLGVTVPPLGGLFAGVENIIRIPLTLNNFYAKVYRLLCNTTTSLAVLAVLLPGSSAVVSYVMTGHLYLGSIIEFWPCKSVLTFSRSSFTVVNFVLEFSYSLVSLVRTMTLYRYSNCAHQMLCDLHKIPEFLKGRTKHWIPHARLMAVGVITPFVVENLCPLQVINNTICTASNLAFLIILNTHTSGSIALYYCGVCFVASHIVNIVVATVSVCYMFGFIARNFVAMAWCIVALFLTVQISINTSTQIIHKLLQPDSDILVKVVDNDDERMSQ